MPPNSVATSATAKMAWRSAATSWCMAAVIAIATFAGDLLPMVHTNMSPHILWKQSQPPPVIWAPARGLRKSTARSWLNTLYVGPHLLIANTQGGSPPLPPCRSGGEDRPPETAAGARKGHADK
jgi:hypothetical protein